MKKILVVFAIVIVTALTAAIAIAADAPASIDLQKTWNVQPEAGKKAQASVIFDHALHQKNNSCTEKCHTTDAGGKITISGEIKGMNDKNPVHALCWSCHVDKKVAKGKVCTTCHKK